MYNLGRRYPKYLEDFKSWPEEWGNNFQTIGLFNEEVYKQHIFGQFDFYRRVIRYLNMKCSHSPDGKCHDFFTEYEKMEGFEQTAGRIIGRPMKPYEEVHALDGFTGELGTEYMVMHSHEDHDRIHSYNPRKDHLFYYPDGSFGVSDRDIKLIVDDFNYNLFHRDNRERMGIEPKTGPRFDPFYPNWR